MIRPRRPSFHQAAIQPAPAERERAGRSRAAAHSLNDAAHKLDHWPPWEQRRGGAVIQAPAVAAPPAERARPEDEARDGDVVAHAGRLVLALGALGVVYGDIGTSPLYTEQVIFTSDRAAAHATVAGAYGVVSLIFWSLMIVVTIKYAGVIMRAHNRGDGGIMALTALVRRRGLTRGALLVTLGIFGAALFFGDGMITPAISVLSAVQGLQVISPGLARLVVPLSLVILIALFAFQRRGTGAVGGLFGPILLVWFTVIGLLGAREVAAHPAVMQALSPLWGARFLTQHGAAGFLTLGGVVLAVTGAEALYADRGHFGAGPIRLSWLSIVLPALVLNYLGQAALILTNPKAVQNPFLLLVPGWGRPEMVVLATAATVIASQAVITGSFSVARQASQLGFLPRLHIRHTSELEGQIYVPAINWGLALGVVVLVLAFRSSTRLADIYGVAVTGTFVLNTILFLAIAGSQRIARWKLAALGTLLLVVEVSFFGANVAKIAHGAWLPLAVGLLMSGVMITWRRGQEIVTRNRTRQEGSLTEFLEGLAAARPPIRRVPGTAIFPSPGGETTPLAMRALVEHNHVLQDRLLIVSVVGVSVPRAREEARFAAEWLGRGLCKTGHLTIRVGYREAPDIPALLALARKRGVLPRDFDLEGATYFLSRISIVIGADRELARWRKLLFTALARNAASPIDHFALPTERTVTVGSQVPV